MYARTLSINTLSGAFNSVISGNNFKNPKPDPEIFLKAANLIKAFPSESVVIEDATVGLQAPKNPGFASIAISDSNDFNITELADISIANLSYYKYLLTIFNI